jgi:hypothetical protein
LAEGMTYTPKSRYQWLEWFEELSYQEQTEAIADMGEQVDTLHAITKELLEAKEFGHSTVPLDRLMKLRFD